MAVSGEIFQSSRNNRNKLSNNAPSNLFSVLSVTDVASVNIDHYLVSCARVLWKDILFYDCQLTSVNPFPLADTLNCVYDRRLMTFSGIVTPLLILVYTQVPQWARHSCGSRHPTVFGLPSESPWLTCGCGRLFLHIFEQHYRRASEITTTIPFQEYHVLFARPRTEVPFENRHSKVARQTSGRAVLGGIRPNQISADPGAEGKNIVEYNPKLNSQTYPIAAVVVCSRCVSHGYSKSGPIPSLVCCPRAD
jgi:hypothetical protein